MRIGRARSPVCDVCRRGARQGAATDSSGSSNALLLLLPAFLDQPGLAQRGYACYPHVLNGQTVMKGGLKAAGSALDWLARLFAGAGGAPDFSGLEKEARSEGWAYNRTAVAWLHLIGSGTPEGATASAAQRRWGCSSNTRAGISTAGCSKSLAFWMRHNLEEMQPLTGLEISTITLTGGAARIQLLRRIKASVLDRPVRVPEIPEAAAAGAALLAGLGSGVFHSPVDAAGSLRYDCQGFEAEPGLGAWYDQIYREAYLPLYQALKPVHTVLNRELIFRLLGIGYDLLHTRSPTNRKESKDVHHRRGKSQTGRRNPG